ncbi:uncharacterized protein K452DRAFT_230780 [Aplosporella prunicola CBS 121167]|uniref:FAD dependent oxidoreductase domain-containing protein n=1 Tax=Aplosporella prunicola CBS 121167 TaxID=1176127 RepID=A0A6A6B9T1_9PEZI|nr:uncharacterized protein K452DRAFT_230780 [Aplosporella prunicola CBS 121167]KAF2140328.1 hypothetical protein K452DRAFT_230780 [Aplosporella prunicola CBS 121167]
MEGAPRAQGVRQELKYCKPIAVIGAGVFGLTSALHLAKAGYKDVTIFDYQEYDKNGYSVREGCDAASADENKILRASYGERKMYQDLAFQAMEVWQEWNEQVKTSVILPSHVSNTDQLWVNSGFLRLSDNGLDEHEHITQENFPAEIRHTQYRITDPQRVADAAKNGIPVTKFDPFDRRARELSTDGMFDGTGGYILASKACSWALHLCKQHGVKLRLGPSYRFTTCNYSCSGSVTGVTTADGTLHPASLVIVACGGWTPSLVPESDTIIEATAGSVLTVRLPKNREDLWKKFDPENFPVWSWKMSSYTKDVNRTSVGGLYGFPRTPDGIVKFGFRGAKWTNYTHVRSGDGRLVSYPKTGEQEVPEPAMEVVQKFCEVNLPELVQLPVEKGRMCWYTDSTDNEFLIDFVPDRKGLMVATGGSGHGFKFLPVLGTKVVDIIEGKNTEFTRAFSWRQRPAAGSANGLEEGPEGWRTLDKQKMTSQWKAKLRTNHSP